MCFRITRKEYYIFDTVNTLKVGSVSSYYPLKVLQFGCVPVVAWLVVVQWCTTSSGKICTTQHPQVSTAPVALKQHYCGAHCYPIDLLRTPTHLALYLRRGVEGYLSLF